MRWRTLPLSSDVCETTSRLLVLDTSGETEFTKFCLYISQGVVHFVNWLLTGTKFSLHTSFEIINIMLLHETNISHNVLC
jgi:hypothetical protein